MSTLEIVLVTIISSIVFIVIFISIVIIVSERDDEELTLIKEMYERDSKLSKKILELDVSLGDKILLHTVYEKDHDGTVRIIRKEQEYVLDYYMMRTVLLYMKEDEYTIIKK